jgi:cytochrome c oxidase subunit 4
MANQAHTQADAHAGEHIGHHVPMWLLVAVFVTLLVLTVITVGATAWDFGHTANLWIAMIIATAKAALVALYFMHLRYDKPIISVILITTLFFVALFIGLTLMDSLAYRQNVQEWRDVDPATRYAPEIPAE